MQRLIDANKLEYTCNSDECGALAGCNQITGCNHCQYHIITEDEIAKASTVLSTPETPTNGDMIRAMLPNAEIDANPYSPSVDIYIGGILMMRVDRNWWNAEYKEPTDRS